MDNTAMIIDEETKIETENNVEVSNIVDFENYAESENELSYYFKLIETTKPLFTEEEEKAYFAEYKKTKSKEIRDEIILRNLRLVVMVAKKYQSAANSMTLMDLISEGNLGLFRAVEGFDIDKGFRFSTYAFNWIRQSITRAIADKDNGIRVPVHMYDHVYKLKRFYARMIANCGREPTLNEIMEKFDIDEDTAINYMKTMSLYDLKSLNMQIGESDHNEISELVDFIPDDNVNIEKECEDTILKDLIAKYLDEYTNMSKSLDEVRFRNKKIIIERFGLDGSAPKSLEQVGDKYGLTRERVRQITEKFVRYLSHPVRKKYLRDFYDNMFQE